MPILPLLLTLAAQGGSSAPAKPANPKPAAQKPAAPKSTPAKPGATKPGTQIPTKAATIPPVAQLGKTDTKIGTGETARIGDVVDMEYVGTLMNGGKEFDRSKDQPFRFQVGIGQVIEGWDQGIPGMKEGGERTLVIPAKLGYGTRGAGDDIPPNADLKFTVKLLRVHPRATFETLTAGQGETVLPGDALEFHYKGTLPDGKVFDSSYDRSQPLQIEMRQMIPGVNQGLIGMKIGEKRKITVPSDLAYGPDGMPRADVKDKDGKVTMAKGSVIPGGATITFEVEMLRILAHKKTS